MRVSDINRANVQGAAGNWIQAIVTGLICALLLWKMTERDRWRNAKREYGNQAPVESIVVSASIVPVFEEKPVAKTAKKIEHKVSELKKVIPPPLHRRLK